MPDEDDEEKSAKAKKKKTVKTGQTIFDRKKKKEMPVEGDGEGSQHGDSRSEGGAHHTHRKHLSYEEWEERYLGQRVRSGQQWLQDLLHLRYQGALEDESIEKNFSHGGFLTKRYTDDKSDWDWICADEEPRDFLTLVRFTVMSKLARDAYMIVRSFLSSDGEFIFVVIKSTTAQILRRNTSTKQRPLS